MARKFRTRIEVPTWIRMRKTEIMYLVLGPEGFRKYAEYLREPKQEFFETLGKHVDAYLKEDVLPPAEIASVVLNVADDVAAGRDPVLRAGDYIAVQQFIR